MRGEASSGQAGGWFLEGLLGPGRNFEIRIDPIPFSVGRQKDSDLYLSARDISRHHAEILRRDGVLWVRDLGSTNGTFLNRERLTADGGEAPLRHGDILHFGANEFRVSLRDPQGREQSDESESDSTRLDFGDELPRHFVQCADEVQELLRNQAVTPYYQPIYALADDTLAGYELLGRGAHPALPQSPGELFGLAERLGVERELSDLFRRVGVARLGEAGAMGQPLFLNTHPSEMRLDTLARVAADLRAAHPNLPLVLEIHEKAVTELGLIRSLRDVLREHGWYLAYDDFGAGQARLLELVQVPPDYLKFDISLIRNIHQQSATVRQVVGTLVRMAEELDIKTLAEGVEVEPEAVVCRDLGFRFVQGYYYGRPAAWGAATG